MQTVISKRNATHYTWGEHCSSWILNDTASLSVKQENMPAGTWEQEHVHTYASQFFWMLQGVAAFYVEGSRIEVMEGEGLAIACGQKHYVVNDGDSSIEFLVISQPNTQHDRINI